MARRRSGGTGGLVLGVLLLVGLVILVIKWLLITALILAVPFGLWWLHDRQQRAAPAGSSTSDRRRRTIG